MNKVNTGAAFQYDQEFLIDDIQIAKRGDNLNIAILGYNYILRLDSDIYSRLPASDSACLQANLIANDSFSS